MRVDICPICCSIGSGPNSCIASFEDCKVSWSGRSIKRRSWSTSPKDSACPAPAAAVHAGGPTEPGESGKAAGKAIAFCIAGVIGWSRGRPGDSRRVTFRLEIPRVESVASGDREKRHHGLFAQDPRLCSEGLEGRHAPKNHLERRRRGDDFDRNRGLCRVVSGLRERTVRTTVEFTRADLHPPVPREISGPVLAAGNGGQGAGISRSAKQSGHGGVRSPPQ